VKLGVVLARRDDVELARALTVAAQRAGDTVRWFAMAEGVIALADALPPPLRDDVELIACATSVDRCGAELPAWVTLGSQDDHAALLAWADRVVALT
jgi:hypothetical protein